MIVANYSGVWIDPEKMIPIRHGDPASAEAAALKAAERSMDRRAEQ